MLGDNRPKKKRPQLNKKQPPTRKDLIKQAQLELYRSTLRLHTPSMGSVPDSKGVSMSEGAVKLDGRLTRQFGELGTGKGFGIAPLSGGVPTIDEDAEALEW